MDALDSAELCPVPELVQCAQLSSWERLWTLHNSSNSWWCNAVDNKTKNLKQSITAVLILNRIFPPHVSRARNWPPPIIKTFHKQYWELDEWNDQRRNIRQTISTRPSSLIFENWLCVNIRFSLSLCGWFQLGVCVSKLKSISSSAGKERRGENFTKKIFLEFFFASSIRPERVEFSDCSFSRFACVHLPTSPFEISLVVNWWITLIKIEMSRERERV